MSPLRIHRVFEYLTRLDLAMGIFWLGLVVFTVGLLILRYTRWGQSHQLQKCMVLSVLAHLLLLGYAATIHIIAPPAGGESMCFIALAEDTDSELGQSGGNRPRGADVQNSNKDESWRVPSDAAPDLKPRELKAAELKAPALLPTPKEPAQESKRLLDDLRSKLLASSSPEQVVAERLTATEPHPVPVSEPIGRLVPLGDDGTVARRETISTPPSVTGASDWSPSDPADIARDSSTPSQSASGGTGGGSLPDLYKLRVMPNRSGVAQGHGATPESEKAVQLALHWLADNQADDGRWDPNEHDAGKELSVQGRNRQNAGNKADTGITGLALLAFLAGGHSHQRGPYAENLRYGLEYLIQNQAADGNLGGKAQTYEFMYCHAMAACALSEAYGMTRDPRLEKPVRRAMAYTVAAQDPRGGGWRYRPGDPGDTSQLGWQLMALKSAELAGIPIPPSTRSGVLRFLQSVSSGKQGGLASYRPAERASRSMTAEALVCRQFLGLPRSHPACNEAGDFLLGELPGSGMANDYYWYYATFAMYQLQGDYWRRWNEALQNTLLARQVKEGPMAGSWNTDTLWGGYGGRVYTTAIATLALEVYYRFLPLYGEESFASGK
jgi:hypothetical protein